MGHRQLAHLRRVAGRAHLELGVPVAPAHQLGAAALKVMTDDETGELEGVTILGQWGEIPDDFAESLQGG